MKVENKDYFSDDCIVEDEIFRALKKMLICPLCEKIYKDPIICSVCQGVYCQKCIDAFMCKRCLNEAQKTMLVKYKCDCGTYLFWRRGLFKKCWKCKIFNNCFWLCIYCKKYYCLNCCKTFKNKCGLMHELKEICLDDYRYNEKMYVKDLLINKILLMRFNCDICKNKFFSRFFYCSRCNLVKCLKCNE